MNKTNSGNEPPHRADIFMILLGQVRHDSRVIKEATSLRVNGYGVTVLEITGAGSTHYTHEHGFEVIQVGLPVVLSRFARFRSLLLPLMLLRGALCVRRVQTGVYHAHDFPALIVLALAGLLGQIVVYDSHELFFDRTGGRSRLYRPLKWLEPRLASRAAAVITVSESIAEVMASRWNIPTPTVICNAVDIRQAGQLATHYPKEEGRVIVHSGRIAHSRHLLELVEALTYLPSTTIIVMMGAVDSEIGARVLKQAQELGKEHNLFLCPPVPVEDVSATLAQADVGVALLPTTKLSYKYSLPNKLFEYVAAGLPVVTSRAVEMAAIVHRYDIGAVCDETDPRSIAKAIDSVLSPVNRPRLLRNVERARRELNWEAEERKLLNLYQRLALLEHADMARHEGLG